MQMPICPVATLETLILITAAVLLGGTVKGFSGFGFAAAATGLTAFLLDPAAAVVVLILPVMAANASLARELEIEELHRCATRFWPYMVSGIAGVVLGMYLLGSFPAGIVENALGVLILGYVALHNYEFSISESLPVNAGIGFVSGIVFGATNIGVQIVAYFDSLDLDHPLFVGLLAFMMVGVSGLRSILAFSWGLYPEGYLLFSVLAVIPGLAGTYLGKKLRTVAPESYRENAVLLLMAVIGFNLLL